MLASYKQIFGYVQRHWLEHTSLKFLVPWALFLIVAVYVRYSSGVDLSFKWFIYLKIAQGLFFTVPFVFTLFLYATVYSKVKELLTIRVAVLIGVICFVLYANQYMLLYRDWLADVPKEVYRYLSRTGYNVHVSFFFLLIPLVYFLSAKVQNRPLVSFYGSTLEGFNYKPYLLILIAAAPFIIWDSFQPGFQQMYPRYLPIAAEPYWGVSPWLTITGYQITYILQFVTLELFYRGFIVFSLAKILKRWRCLANGQCLLLSTFY